MMQLGADGVFVGSGIFKSGDPAARARAIVEATTIVRRPGDAGQGVARSRRADGRHRDPDAARGPAVRRPGLVTAAAARPAGPRVGVLALQGDVREHLAALSSAGADCGAGASGVGARRCSTASSCPAASRRRSAGCWRSSTCSSRCETAIADGTAGVRLVRGHDPAGARDPGRPARPAAARRPGHRRCGATPSAGRWTRSRPTWTWRASTGGPDARRLHPRAVGGESRETMSRCSR